MSAKNTKSVTEEELTKIKNKLEMEGIKKSKIMYATDTINEKNITDALASGAKQFEQQTGRPMTYSEMREMFG
jgi:hypothetical protein